MTDLIIRLQNWYKTHCNGDWEHSYGISLSTLDNPGWHFIIALNETALEQLTFKSEYHNEDNEHDWYFIRVKDSTLDIACGPDNLTQVLQIFLDEIIPTQSNPNFLYDIYIPMKGYQHDLWTIAKGKLIKKDMLELVDVPSIDFKQIKAATVEHFNFTEEDIVGFEPIYKVGEQVITAIKELNDGVTLIANSK